MNPELDPKPITSMTALVRPPADKKPNWLIIGLVAALFVMTGVAAYGLGQAGKSKAAATPTPIASASVAPVGTNPASVYAGWKQYCSESEGSCFNYPADWTTKDVGGGAHSNNGNLIGDGVQLTSPAGTVMEFQSPIEGLGGACDIGSSPHIYINKVIASKVAHMYIVEVGGNGVTTHIALVSDTNGVPKVGDTGDCMYISTFASRTAANGGNGWFATNIYQLTSLTNPDFKTADVTTIEQILESYTY